MATNPPSTESNLFQIFVTLLNRKTLTLNYPTSRISASDVKYRLSEITKIPASLQRLVTGNRQLDDESELSCANGERLFPSVALLLRLRGGKGGFGSLLRGAGSKAWQKKTNNVDACRDMSGRRLRHVNAERRLEEWRAGEEERKEERKLEKKAEEFLKKIAKKGKRGGDSAVLKYVEKCAKDSERCVSGVLDAVEESVKGKRKGCASKDDSSKAKRLKIWMGKQKLAGSDSEDSEDEEETEKSTVSNDDGTHSDSSKDAQGSSGSVSCTKRDRELSGGASPESGCEEEKETGRVLSEDSPSDEQNDAPESVHEVVLDEKVNQNEPIAESIFPDSESSPLESGLTVLEAPVLREEVAEIETPLNFDKFNSAAELEVLGMERLKSELQDRGLKCGGTQQERAARLFLLKLIPLDKLPKKLFAKK